MNDATLPATTADAARLGLRVMPLDRIAPTSRFQPRRAAASAEDDDGLRQSIARLGLLDPILLWRVPDTEPETWEIVAGNRRRAAFAAVGSIAIAYEVFAGTEAEAHAAATASNTQRVPLAPVDTWRAIRAQQEMGWALDDAARALGIPLRTARRLDKLGQLHPDILAAIETGGMPDEDDAESMHVVASAPLDVQARAVQHKHAFLGSGKTHAPDWGTLRELCTIARIPKPVAIFDVEASGIVFEEDLFAEPGDARAITTTDVAGFLDAQRQALQDLCARSKAKTKRHAVRWDAKKGHPALPVGWTITYDKRVGMEAFEAVVESGYDLGKIQVVHAIPPAKVLAEREAAAKEPAPAGTAAASAEAGEEPEPDEQEDESKTRAPAPTKPTRPPLTHAGQELVAKAKTDGIHAALKDRRDQLTDRQLLGLLVLALCGDNVSVKGNPAGVYVPVRFHDLAARLIYQDGQPRDVETPEVIRYAAAEAIARMVVCSPVRIGDSSGAAAEWIGAVLAPALPRLDTPEILATVRGDALAAAAIAAGDSGKGTTKELRERLANKCPDLKLPGCDFQARGPDPESTAGLDDEEGEDGEGSDE